MRQRNYIRQCSVCWKWAPSTDPREERYFRDCPVADHGPMKLSFMTEAEFAPVACGEKIDLPPSYLHNEY